MERRETISVNLSDIDNCIQNKIFEKYPYLRDDADVHHLELESNIKFILYKVIRSVDLAEVDEVKNKR